ncbi:MAG: anthranilate phosphoribosyltransferase [Candidatus Lindowbacteria bacterium RIFCSPLOWO2_12_FULL_62_27]|nr:MAG: anthranilate phosphoribosyltransferase [Candidatus Lindowbacteria bacterium RIFCSPLOWO2_02_FULL_62_12]OGH62981.1 MAG: anthranilate phosphoribosyltransferase [Candidatus Lindowbacteria bacterium RIFCSPLOWO2_12_FULL_62_27]
MEKQDLGFKALLEKLLQGKSLDPGETAPLFEGLTGDAPPEMKAAVLAALRVRGETVTEILGLAREMRAHAVALPEDMRQALDTCGTGGDGSRSLNLSTISAILLSSMNVPIVKHGNRSVSSSCGSADVLEGLGLPLDLSPDASAQLFRETQFAFLFAPLYHPAMKSIAPVRKALQVRTVFNFLGPLANPARVHHQIVGVPAPERVRPFAEVLKGLGLKSAMVVHGEPALDEISPCGKTRAACFFQEGDITEVQYEPHNFGVPPVAPDRLKVSDVREAVARASAVLSGKGAESDQTAVAVNAAAALLVVGRVSTVAEGATAALSHLASGQAAKHLEKIIETAGRLKSHA